MSHFSHNVPYIESKSEAVLCYISFRHITSLQKDISLPLRIQVLEWIYYVMFFHNIIYIIKT